MLQEAEMVKFENAVKGFFNAVCDVYEYKESIADGISSFLPSLVQEGIICRRGYSSGAALSNVKTGDLGDDNSNIQQLVKLFLPKEVKIKPGSLVKVIYGGCDEYYEYSGYELYYKLHNEVFLKTVERWA